MSTICPHCNAEIPGVTDAFCPHCREELRVEEPTPRKKPVRRQLSEPETKTDTTKLRSERKIVRDQPDRITRPQKSSTDSRSQLGSRFPIGSACPQCGQIEYEKVKPETWVCFTSDRVCTSCNTRYTPPTPVWAGVLFFVFGLPMVIAFGVLAFIQMASQNLFGGLISGGLMLMGGFSCYQAIECLAQKLRKVVDRGRVIRFAVMGACLGLILSFSALNASAERISNHDEWKLTVTIFDGTIHEEVGKLAVVSYKMQIWAYPIIGSFTVVGAMIASVAGVLSTPKFLKDGDTA